MTTPIDLSELHREYAAHGLNRRDLDPDPIKQFSAWFTASIEAGIPDVNAMSLATANADGKPSVRIVLLKGFDESGFVFYTNYASEKGRQLDENPRAALAIFWQQLERQVRIEGSVEKHLGRIPFVTFIPVPAAASSAHGRPIKAKRSMRAESLRHASRK